MDNIVSEMEKKSSASDFYKIKEGNNVMRILTDFVKVETINTKGKYGGIVSETNQPDEDDTVQMKGWAWAIVRGSPDELKIVQFGKTILSQLVAYRKDPEYAYDAMPCPYDVNIKAIGAGTKEVEYTVIPARQNTDVTEKEIEMLNKKKTIKDIVALIVEKQDEKQEAPKVATPYQEEDIDPSKIPF